MSSLTGNCQHHCHVRRNFAFPPLLIACINVCVCRYLACLWNKLYPARQIAVDHFIANVPFVDLMEDTPPSQKDYPPTCCGDSSSLINAWMIRTNFQATKEVIDGKFDALRRFNQAHFDRVRQLMAAMAFAYNPNCFFPFGKEFYQTLAIHFKMDCRLNLCYPGHSKFNPKISDHLHSFLISFQHLFDLQHLSISGNDVNFMEHLSSTKAEVFAKNWRSTSSIADLICSLLGNCDQFFSSNGCHEISYPGSGETMRLSTCIDDSSLLGLVEKGSEENKFIIFTPKQDGAPVGIIVMGDFKIRGFNFKVISVITVTADGCAAYTVKKDAKVAAYINGKIAEKLDPTVSNGLFQVLGRVKMIFVRVTAVQAVLGDDDLELRRSPEIRGKLGLPRMKPFVARELSPDAVFAEVIDETKITASNCLGKFGLFFQGQHLAQFLLECTLTAKRDVRVLTLQQLDGSSREVYSVTLTVQSEGWTAKHPRAKVTNWTCVDRRDDEISTLFNAILLHVVMEYCKRVLMLNIIASNTYSSEFPRPINFDGFTTPDSTFLLDFQECKKGIQSKNSKTLWHLKLLFFFVAGKQQCAKLWEIGQNVRRNANITSNKVFSVSATPGVMKIEFPTVNGDQYEIVFNI